MTNAKNNKFAAKSSTATPVNSTPEQKAMLDEDDISIEKELAMVMPQTVLK